MAKVLNWNDMTRYGHHEYVITNGSDKPSVSCDVTMFGNPMDLLYGDPNENEVTESTWWDSAYAYRRKMDIYAVVSGISVPSGSVIQVGVDVNIMYSGGKCLANYDDVRIARFKTVWQEFPRDYITSVSHPATSTQSTKFLFKLDEDINVRDDTFYLYYGNPGAGVPTSGVVTPWDYQDDFGGAALGAGWVTSGTGVFTETGGYLQIQHTSVTYSTNGGWDDCPVAYRAVSNEEFLIETKVTFENGSNEQGGIIVMDGTRSYAVMFGLRDTFGTLTVQGSYVVGGKLVDSGTVAGAINYYYRMYVNRNGVALYYSTNGTTWTLYGAYNIPFKIKWVGLYMRNTSSTNSNYQRFEYFYMTNRNIGSLVDEEQPTLGNRMRGKKGFKSNVLVPYNQF